MLEPTAISVIILATSLEVTKQGEQYSYFFRRALPMKSTWASLFDLELAFGTNVFDNEFLLKHCAGLRRRLRVTAPQTPPRDTIESYECDEGLRVLYFANCTGEYMGAGPVCRCQEAIRYWQQSPRFKDTRWFAFMDDDVYLRPWPLVGLLSGFDDAQPAAFVGAHGNRGLALTRDRWKQCGELCAFRFPWAQPAILSRGAIESMRSMTDRSYMTAVQKLWFGTHDVILGLALWWWSIPILSLGNLRIRDLPRKSKHGAIRPPGAEHRDVGIMLHYVRNEPQPPNNISSAALFEFLKDGDEQHKQHQLQIGVHARHRLKIFRNDGARSLRPDVAPTNATYVFHPDACVGQTPSTILAPDANRAPPEKCVFHDFGLATSDLRSPDANVDAPLHDAVLHATHRPRRANRQERVAHSDRSGVK